MTGSYRKNQLETWDFLAGALPSRLFPLLLTDREAAGLEKLIQYVKHLRPITWRLTAPLGATGACAVSILIPLGTSALFILAGRHPFCKLPMEFDVSPVWSAIRRWAALWADFGRRFHLLTGFWLNFSLKEDCEPCAMELIFSGSAGKTRYSGVADTLRRVILPDLDHTFRLLGHRNLIPCLKAGHEYFEGLLNGAFQNLIVHVPLGDDDASLGISLEGLSKGAVKDRIHALKPVETVVFDRILNVPGTDAESLSMQMTMNESKNSVSSLGALFNRKLSGDRETQNRQTSRVAGHICEQGWGIRERIELMEKWHGRDSLYQDVYDFLEKPSLIRRDVSQILLGPDGKGSVMSSAAFRFFISVPF